MCIRDRFLSQPRDGTKECIVNVTYGSNCGQKLDVYTGVGANTSVTTSPLDLLGNVANYCFTVTARNNDETVIVEGTLNIPNNGNIYTNLCMD